MEDLSFSNLFSFLEQFGPEAAGRQRPDPTPELVPKLVRFADGGCGDAERAEVCELLRRDPSLMRWVADHVKRSRSKASVEESVA